MQKHWKNIIHEGWYAIKEQRNQNWKIGWKQTKNGKALAV